MGADGWADTLGIDRMRVRDWLAPRSLWRYLRAFFRGSRPGMIAGDWRQRPGVAVLDASGAVRYLHRGTGLGDYPSLEALIGRLREIVST